MAGTSLNDVMVAFFGGPSVDADLNDLAYEFFEDSAEGPIEDE